MPNRKSRKTTEIQRTGLGPVLQDEATSSGALTGLSQDYCLPLDVGALVLEVIEQDVSAQEQYASRNMLASGVLDTGASLCLFYTFARHWSQGSSDALLCGKCHRVDGCTGHAVLYERLQALRGNPAKSGAAGATPVSGKYP